MTYGASQVRLAWPRFGTARHVALGRWEGTGAISWEARVLRIRCFDCFPVSQTWLTRHGTESDGLERYCTRVIDTLGQPALLSRLWSQKLKP